MSKLQRLLVTVLSGGRQTYENYVLNTLQPELWMRHRETSGSTITDSSGHGRNGTLTLGAGALAQDGFDAPNEAILADGSTTKIAIASNAALKNPAFWFAFLCKPSSAGENSTGALMNYSDAGDTALRFNLAANVFTMTIGAATTTGQTTTTTGTTVTLNEWQWIFGALSNIDKKCRIWKGRLGVLTEFAYSTQTAYVGAMNGAAILNLLNSGANNRTWAGLVDESIYVIGEPDTAKMQQLINLKGV